GTEEAPQEGIPLRWRERKHVRHRIVMVVATALQKFGGVGSPEMPFHSVQLRNSPWRIDVPAQGYALLLKQGINGGNALGFGLVQTRPGHGPCASARMSAGIGTPA